MKFTKRDYRLVGDISLSHVMSRDQAISLKFFSSVPRANARLLALCRADILRRLETPFFRQGLYIPGRLAKEVVPPQIAALLRNRSESPRFVRHALQTTNCRIKLLKNGGEWRFEQQLWRTFDWNGRIELRPDGMVITSTIPVFVEICLGHVSPKNFGLKLSGFKALANSGKCQELYGFPTFRLLTITTGSLRARHLLQRLPNNPGFDFMCKTYEELGIEEVPNWS